MIISFSFFFNDTATTEIYTLSLHDALPISIPGRPAGSTQRRTPGQKEVIPFEWKVCGHSFDHHVLTLFKSVERADAEAQLARLRAENYYENLNIYRIDEKVPAPAQPRKSKTTVQKEKRAKKAEKKADTAKKNVQTSSASTKKTVKTDKKKAATKTTTASAKKKTTSEKATKSPKKKTASKKAASKKAASKAK